MTRSEQSTTPVWRKSIRSNASGGCVEVTWFEGMLPGDPGENIAGEAGLRSE
ncbi:DUF397 domain-containing protein [Actinoallomurus soli]|uniref:DUF397 domain-containing protein n=1 Tax=Actinoallomurus soli TaxID=2952535 RepID=UPI003872B7B0